MHRKDYSVFHVEKALTIRSNIVSSLPGTTFAAILDHRIALFLIYGLCEEVLEISENLFWCVFLQFVAKETKPWKILILIKVKTNLFCFISFIVLIKRGKIRQKQTFGSLRKAIWCSSGDGSTLRLCTLGWRKW